MLLLINAAFVVLSWSSIANADFYPITGVHQGQGNDGSWPSRLEIGTLKNNNYAWPLFVQSFAALQQRAPTSLTSYFEIAGIHGRPYKAWDNVDGSFGYTGYCTHFSVLFPSWHRPYLALFEQEMNAQAVAIANQYTGSDKAKYQAAAKTLRLPYWDWAVSPAIPPTMKTPKISITTPKGTQLIDNPLYAYRFPPLDPYYFPSNPQVAGDAFLATDPTTVRDPNADANLAAAGLTLMTYHALMVTDYTTFATQAVQGTSIEAVHGIVHVSVGGDSGHMSYLSYAGFDPVFWLHHANVDRLIAIWQAINPDAYIPSSGVRDSAGTFTIPQGTIEYSSTGLTPFTSSTNGTMYNSDTARNPSTFGYTYPEISGVNQTPATVKQKVNALYNRSGKKPKKYLRDISTTASAIEWFVTIRVDRFALDKSFMVLVFLGDLPSDTTTYRRASSLAGSLFVSLPQNQNTGKDHMTMYGEVPLKGALDKAELPDYSETTVAAYLTQNLQWIIQKTDGSVVQASQCPSLNITVYDMEVTLPKDEYEFPKYGKKTAHPEITTGKAGGE